ncbi:cytochrome P450 [Exidia glandulosa HHB12029]|uniref:Cytochrome P450 n=1 Tax=Exidia glandulosa HHB12029 TaxID=1314781 RepID=A0A165C4J0_EXIGL|nr:cytochrome P450 [Exidia glandulosa HHB12029]
MRYHIGRRLPSSPDTCRSSLPFYPAMTFLDAALRALTSVSWTQLAIRSAEFYAAWTVATFIHEYWRTSRSPLRYLPQPKESANWVFGHMRAMFSGENNEVQERWIEQLGDTFVVRSLLGKYLLVTTDPRANTHILFASHIYQKTELARRSTQRFVGEGVLTTEGAQHRDQRRLLNPAFGSSHVRDMTEIFLEKGAKLREIWHNKCIEAGGSVKLDVLHWISQATLDAIGKAGFDYDFGTLNETGETNELAEVFEQVFRTDFTLFQQMRLMLNETFPLLRAIAPGSRAKMGDAAKKKMDEIGMRIVQDRKAALLAELGESSVKIDKNTMAGKDLITLLLRANLAADADMRLTDEEVYAQIPTFLVAGHETTSNTTTWAMECLAQNLEAQKKLRDEVLAVPTETPTLDMLNALPYLDQVTREVLRLHSAVTFVQREAIMDDVIPLSNPVVDRTGKTVTQISVQKGDEVMVPIWLINRSKAIWGPDAGEFRPERWDSPPQEATSIPGITPNLISFIGIAGGPRSCIGFRFALAEMKALIFHIARGFEFKLAVDPSEMWSRTGILMRPQLRSNNSIELPVILTPIA